MQTIAVRIDPPAPAGLRHAFPARLRELAGGLVAAHAADGHPATAALLFTFEVADALLAVEIVANLVGQERIDGHDLRGRCTVAVKRGERFEVVFPPGAAAAFP